MDCGITRHGMARTGSDGRVRRAVAALALRIPRLMRHLVPERSRVLCQKEAVIDWILGQERMSLDPVFMCECLLSALPPSESAETRIRGWFRYLRG